MSQSEVPSGGARFLMGIAFAAAGIVPILAAFDIGPLHSDSINGPPWIGAVAGGIFLMGAVFLFAYGATVRYPWLGSLLALVLIAGFAALGNWIAFGAGTRECSGSFSLAIFTDSRWVGEIECRAAFGIGAMMTNGLVVLILGAGLKQMGVTGWLPDWLEKIGLALLVIAFAPLVVLFIVLSFGKWLVESCWAYLRTGKWPDKAQSAK